MTTSYDRRLAEFSWIWSRRDIERRLANEFPYCCPAECCGSRFSTRSALSRHQRAQLHWGHFQHDVYLHRTQVTCECGYCPSELVMDPKQAFRRHRRRKHKIYVRFYKIREYP